MDCFFDFWFFYVCITGRITSSESLFSYPVGKSYSDYNGAQQRSFVPTFKASLLSSASPEERELCGNDTDCLFDFIVTGSRVIATATRAFSVELEEAEDAAVIGKTMNTVSQQVVSNKLTFSLSLWYLSCQYFQCHPVLFFHRQLTEFGWPIIPWKMQLLYSYVIWAIDKWDRADNLFAKMESGRTFSDVHVMRSSPSHLRPPHRQDKPRPCPPPPKTMHSCWDPYRPYQTNYKWYGSPWQRVYFSLLSSSSSLLSSSVSKLGMNQNILSVYITEKKDKIIN